MKIRTLSVILALKLGTLSLLSQTTYTFTTAGSTGSLGPTQAQVNAAYLSTNLSGAVSVTAGIQYWTVPASGIYRIETNGAKGGNASAPGGSGARMRGDFSLVGGQVLKILIGQEGQNGFYQGGGGGGTYVATISNTPLCIAGGGGGAYNAGNSFGSANMSGTTSTSGNSGINANALNVNGTGGTGGNGGNVGTLNAGFAQGSGGGGLIGNGANGYGTTGGLSFVNGGTGGLAQTGGTPSNAGNGGFGGGGGSDWSYWTGAGGGGGYSGGGSGYYYGCGGGGGSFNSGTNQLNSSGVNLGPGYAIITRLTGVSITMVSPVTCNGSGNAVLSATTTGGTPPYNYLWSTGATVTTISGLAPGTYSISSTDAASVTYTSTFVVLQPPVITTSVVAQTSLNCNGGANGLLTVSVTGGVSPYTYTWSPSGGNTTTAAGLSAGVYSCNITDANGCLATRSATLLQPPPLNIIAFATSPVVCSGNTVALIGGGANTYTWSGGVSNGIPFTPVLSSTYIVNATNANGCQGTAITSITVIPSPTLSVSGTGTVCSGSPAVLTASGAITYTWSNLVTGTIVTVTPSVTNVYTVYGSGSNGCIASLTKTVTALNLPNVVANANNSSICLGASLILTGSGAISYTWSNGVVNGVAFIPSASTVYTLTGVDINGCQNTAIKSISVNPIPVVSITGASVICLGSNAVLTATGASTYFWNNFATSASISISPVSANQYSVIGTSATGCTNSATQVVLVNNLPSISASSSNSVVCEGSSMVLNASGGLSYTWQPGNLIGQNITASPSVATIFTVVGKDVNGCSNSATLNIGVNSIPLVSISAQTLLCAGESITMTASGAVSYSWQPINIASSEATVAPMINTSYTVIGTGTNGCSGSATVALSVLPGPTLTVNSTPSVICLQETASIIAGGANSYVWNTSTTGPLISVSPSVNTVYSVTGIGTNGCASTYTYELQVFPCTGIDYREIESSSAILVIPNPNNGEFNIRSSSEMSFYLINNIGQIIHRDILTEENAYEYYFKDLSNGIYFIVAKGELKTITQKIIVNK